MNYKILFIFIILIFSISTVYADDTNQTIYVDSNSNQNGNGTLTNPLNNIDDAVNLSGDGSTIYVKGGNYTSSELIINKKVTFQSYDGIATFKGSYDKYLFYISEESSLTLNNICFEKVYNTTIQSYGMIMNYGTLSVENSSFSQNSGLRAGSILNYGTLTVSDSTFTNNSARYYGGAISNFGFADIFNSTFTDNHAGDGSAIINTLNLEIYSSTLRNNDLLAIDYQELDVFTKIASSEFMENTSVIANNTSLEVTESYLNMINTSNSNVGVSYSIIYDYDFTDSKLNVENNLWDSHKNMPPEVKNYLVMLLVDESSGSSQIPLKTDSNLTVTFKSTDGRSTRAIADNINLPSIYITFEADNGKFNISGGYVKNNLIHVLYHSNTRNTVIYANLNDYSAKLYVGNGYDNGKIYVSNNGSDTSGDGSSQKPYKTLSKAVSSALNGDTIYLTQGSYYGELNTAGVNKTLNIVGLNGEVTIYRSDSKPVFKITKRGELLIKNLTLTVENKNNIVPIVNNSGKLTIDSCIFKNANGGRNYILGEGIRRYYINQSIIYSYNDLYINNSQFIDLEDVVIRMPFLPKEYEYFNQSLIIENSVFKNSNALPWHYSNDVYKGDIIATPSFLINCYADNILINNCEFRDNTMAAIRAKVNNQLSINNSRFINNYGSVYLLDGYGVINNTFVSEDNGPTVNYVPSFIPIIIGVSTVENSLFTKNKDGIINTGYFDSDNNVLLYNCSFIDNEAVHPGGQSSYAGNGLIENGANLTVNYCTFVNNYAFYGGAIYNTGSSTVYDNHISVVNVTNTVFCNNSAQFGSDIFSRGGMVYTSDCWWASNRGPNDSNLFKARGDIIVNNWVILSFDLLNNTLIASLNKTTNQNGDIMPISGVLPERLAIFKSSDVEINPNTVPVINNIATTDISFDGEDIKANVTVDNQSIDLIFYNRNTVFSLNDLTVYGRGTVYSVTLKSINGYSISNQTFKLEILNGTRTYQTHTLTTDSSGNAEVVINCSMGNYTFKASYDGDGYFRSTQKTASLEVLPYFTSISIKENQTFYGDMNMLYANLYDNFGNAISNQIVTFNITSNENTYVRYALTDFSGQAGIYLNLPKGSYYVNASYGGDNWHFSTSGEGQFTITTIGTILSIEQSQFNGRGNTLTVLLRDTNYRTLFNQSVEITLSDADSKQTFHVTTNEDGRAGIIVNLVPGIYNVQAQYLGNSLNVLSRAESDLTIRYVQTQITVNPVLIFTNTSNIYDVHLKDIYGRALENESLLITIISQNTGVKQMFNVKTNASGTASLNCSLDVGNYLVKVNFNSNEWYTDSYSASTLIVTQSVDGFDSHATFLIANDLVKYYRNQTQYIVLLHDLYGNPIANQNLTISINGVSYNRITNESGQAKLNINLSPGTYVVDTSFHGTDNLTKSKTNTTVEVLSQIISGDLVKMYKNESQFIIQYVDNTGIAKKDVEINFTINGVVYKRITNQTGHAKLNINLQPGTYEITTQCGVFINRNSITVSSQLTTQNLDMYYKDGSRFTATVKDNSGKLKANETVTFIINGVEYQRRTNENGTANLNINLDSNIYTIITKYNDITNENRITIYNMAVHIDASDENIQRHNPFVVKLTDALSKPIVNKEVSFKINGVDYIRLTNETGHAKLNINLRSGTYKIVTAFSIQNYEDKLIHNTLKVTD